MQEQRTANSIFAVEEGFFSVKAVALVLINLAATLLVYLPYMSVVSGVLDSICASLPYMSRYVGYFNDPTVISRYLDGPLYIFVAKTLYIIPANTPIPGNLPDFYFACHLALFPLLIRIFSFMGYAQAMIFIVLVASTLSILVFYQLVKEFKYSVDPFWLSLVFIFFPSRWLLYHSIGAAEPLFVLLVLASLYCFKKDWPLAACALAGLATVTKIFGILLFVSYAALYIYNKQYRRLPYTLLIPALLVVNFLVYQLVFGDFFAYFKWNGSFMSLLPFMDFFGNAAVGITNNAELFMAMYLLYFIGTLRLRKFPELLAVALPFALFMAFVYHPDISRYLLPIAPLALLIGFDDVISRWEFKVIFPLIIVFGYVYCWGIIPTNLMSPGDYASILAISP